MVLLCATTGTYSFEGRVRPIATLKMPASVQAEPIDNCSGVIRIRS